MTSPFTGHLLLAFQHADGQFPSGGFAFSQGLEASSQLASLLGPFDFASFLQVQVRHRWAEADRVALIRAHRLGGDLSALAALDAEVEASTFIEGLRSGSRRNGTALLTTHARMGTRGAADYRSMVRAGSAHGHLPAVAMSGYQAASSLTTAAIRLGLIGAILEGARDGRSVAELMSLGSQVLTQKEVLPGVAAMLPMLQVEATFRDGTKLVTVHDPLRPAAGMDIEAMQPGELIVAEGEIELNAGRPKLALRVVNTGDRPVQLKPWYDPDGVRLK